MKTAYVFLADGFEEIEAVTPIDTLRRAGVTVHTVGVTGKTVDGAHGIPMVADMDGEGFTLPADADLVLLPGGGTGTQNLAKSAMVAEVLKAAAAKGITIAAICAAPTVLGAAGLLQGKNATAYPSEQAKLAGAKVTGEAVAVDGNIITGRSAGVALAFSQALMTALVGADKAAEVVASLYPEA